MIEPITNLFKDYDHLEATIVMEGARRFSGSSSWSLRTRLITGYTSIDFKHRESMKLRRC